MTIHAYKKAAVSALALTALACAAPAFAAGDYHIKFGGVDGEVKEPKPQSAEQRGHDKWIILESVQLGAERTAGITVPNYGASLLNTPISGSAWPPAKPGTPNTMSPFCYPPHPPPKPQTPFPNHPSCGNTPPCPPIAPNSSFDRLRMNGCAPPSLTFGQLRFRQAQDMLCVGE
jgi:hypothetical protein